MVVLLLVAQTTPAGAVAVSTTLGNTSAPPDGLIWQYVGRRGAATAVYLGNRTFLTADHIGSGSVTLPSGTYSLEPGSAMRLQNPSGSGLSTHTDLEIFRVTQNPGLPAMPVSAVPPPIDAEVVLIGRGRNRAVSETAWDVNVEGNDWTWTETPPPGDYRGFKTTSSQPMRWGTNLIEDDEPHFGEGDADHHLVYSAGFGHVAGLITQFDESAATPYEAQAISGDSGGGVFYNNPETEKWELAGSINVISTHRDQPSLTAVYGNLTLMADLSFYRDEILAAVGPTPATVVGRHIFYDNSRFDGPDGLLDSDAIAIDKLPLLPGETATFENYTSYSRGINGIMIDAIDLPEAPTLAEFEFRVGSREDFDSWDLAPEPESFAVLPGAGPLGADRIIITWVDGAIANQWLEVKMLANDVTQLIADDVFYFGNAIAEGTGGVNGLAQVDPSDELGARNNLHGFTTEAAVDDAWDFNRDGLVETTDQLLARHNGTSFLSALRLISAPAPQSQPFTSLPVSAVAVPEPPSWLLGTIAIVLGLPLLRHQLRRKCHAA
ncbi:MAG: hypothetical protein WDZ59_16085 [Pirellulales bacterium]